MLINSISANNTYDQWELGQLEVVGQSSPAVAVRQPTAVPSDLQQHSASANNMYLYNNNNKVFV